MNYKLFTLIIENYQPDTLFIGQYFTMFTNTGFEVYQLNHIPRKSVEDWLEKRGFPVKFKLVEEGNPNLNEAKVVATHEQIGWWDESTESDIMSDINLTQLNYILNEQAGLVNVEVEYDEEEQNYLPTLYENKVTMCPLDYEMYEDEEN